MIVTNLFRKAKAAAVKVEKAVYEVVAGFHLKHVFQDVGSFVELAADEAKYHLMAGRVKPVVATETVTAPAPVVTPAPATPVVTPASTASEAADGDK